MIFLFCLFFILINQGTGNGNGPKSFLETMQNIRSNSITPPNSVNQSQQAQPEHCLETLLHNIEGLLAIATHNARQQQTQLQLQKGKFTNVFVCVHASGCAHCWVQTYCLMY